MNNKDEEFWKELNEWDVMMLMETWVDEKGWKKIRDKLPKGYRWEKQWAGRKNKKGTAIGGLIVGIRRGVEVGKEREDREVEGIMSIKIQVKGRWWRVIGVYVNNDLDNKLEKLREWMEEREEEEVGILIGGDFNARTGREGGEAGEGMGGGENGERNLKDGKINSEGKRLCKFIRERGWSILNGNVRGDEEGEWTYTGGRGDSVIDYVLGDERTRERIREVRVEEKVDLDHRPITVWLEGSERQGSREDKRGKRRGIKIWTEENKEKFRVMFGERGGEKEDVEKEWERLRGSVKESLKKIEEKDRKEEKRGWWDRELQGRKIKGESRVEKMEKGRGGIVRNIGRRN